MVSAEYKTPNPPKMPVGELDTIETRMTYNGKVFAYLKYMKEWGLEPEPIKLMSIRSDLE